MITTEEIEHLYRCHYCRMYMVARAMLCSGDEAADIVNDVFADILSGKTMVPSGCSDGWWIVAVRNRCLNVISRRSVRQRVEGLLMIDGMSDIVQSDAGIIGMIDSETDRLDRVYEYICTALTPQTRRILLMHYREKKTYSSIAAELGISETAVYKHLAKGIRQIKENIQ